MALGMAPTLFFWSEMRSLLHPVLEAEYDAVRCLLSTLFRKFGDVSEVTASGEPVGPASLPAGDQ